MNADRLGLAVHALARAHRVHLGTLLAPHGLHVGQDLVLLAIWDTPGLRQRDIAARLRIEPPTATRMLQRLERGGLIERRPDPHDARVVRIFPTPRSRLLEGLVRRAWDELDQRIIAALGETDADRLRRLARAAAAAIADGD
jgi:DNA-binding MarR family transcriptional regulator